MTTILFSIGLAAITAGIAMLSIPAALIVFGATLAGGGVLIERGQAAAPDAVGDAARAHQADAPTS